MNDREIGLPPTQAVILAGGRGTRLQPLTDSCPKPLIGICGKPFLEYLLEMLAGQGFRRVLLLLGYMPEKIMDYSGDGSRWGIDIHYSVTGPDDGTAYRVSTAVPLLDPCFMLMYCDNYWPMQLSRMWQRFIRSGKDGMVTVYANQDGYTKNCMHVDESGMVDAFDRSRSMPQLNGVEIGYAILRRSVAELLDPDDRVSLFEQIVYPKLIEKRQLAAYLTDHRYYSVGSLQRLPLTEAFLSRRPAVLLDRDGVLNKRPPRAEYVRRWSDFEWLPGAREAIHALSKAGYRIAIISNQAGIARGALSEEDLADINRQMKADAAASGGHIDAIYCCPHNWEEGCQCRKPRPGLLFQAQRDLNLDLTRTLFVGDDSRDREAAEAAGCPFQMVTPENSLLDIVKDIIPTVNQILTPG